jgi:hypothetical protein
VVHQKVAGRVVSSGAEVRVLQNPLLRNYYGPIARKMECMETAEMGVSGDQPLRRVDVASTHRSWGRAMRKKTPALATLFCRDWAANLGNIL